MFPKLIWDVISTYNENYEGLIEDYSMVNITPCFNKNYCLYRDINRLSNNFFFHKTPG